MTASTQNGQLLLTVRQVRTQTCRQWAASTGRVPRALQGHPQLLKQRQKSSSCGNASRSKQLGMQLLTVHLPSSPQQHLLLQRQQQGEQHHPGPEGQGLQPAGSRVPGRLCQCWHAWCCLLLMGALSGPWLAGDAAAAAAAAAAALAAAVVQQWLLRVLSKAWMQQQQQQEKHHRGASLLLIG
jgi:hypothetical protein